MDESCLAFSRASDIIEEKNPYRRNIHERRSWDAARRWFLVLATILMIVGYMTSLRLLLASSAIPLALVLIATLRIKRLEGPKQ